MLHLVAILRIKLMFLFLIDEYKGKISEARKLIEDLKKKVREADSKVLANERIINDLRMQIPSTVDR